MSTATESLVERARLTEEEAEARLKPAWNPAWPVLLGRTKILAEAQLAKAFDLFGRWLRAYQSDWTGTDGASSLEAQAFDMVANLLEHELDAAGIERPGGG